MRILILIPQFIKYCRIMYDYIFQKDRSVFIPIGIKRIRQYSVQLYCRILRTRQSACFIWYSRYPYDNSPKEVRFFRLYHTFARSATSFTPQGVTSLGEAHIIAKHIVCTQACWLHTKSAAWTKKMPFFVFKVQLTNRPFHLIAHDRFVSSGEPFVLFFDVESQRFINTDCRRIIRNYI